MWCLIGDIYMDVLNIVFISIVFIVIVQLTGVAKDVDHYLYVL